MNTRRPQQSVTSASIVVDIIREASDGGHLVDRLGSIVELAVSFPWADSAGVYLLFDDTLHLVAVAPERFDTGAPDDHRRRCAIACAERRVVIDPSDGGRTVAAVPIIMRGRVVGALSVTARARIPSDEIDGARLLADVAAVLVASGDPDPDYLSRLRTVRAALDGRAMVEQATGMLAERYGVSLDTAANAMVEVGRINRVGVVAVGASIVDRTVDPVILDRLLANAQ